ncbi:MAG: hypothetical protein M3O36_03850, partial [Myxococcota bacterium]|nr:hypothetical protein [Myxococcota bacterium]
MPLATLSPDLLEALRRIIPRRRPAKLPYIVALGLLGVVGAVAADPSARELVAARLHVSRAQKA